MARLAAGVDRYGNGYRLRFSMNGRQYAVYGASVKEVKEKEIKKRQEIEEGSYKTGESINLDDYFERWIEAKEGTAKETTLRANRMMYRAISKAEIDKTGTRFGELKIKAIEVQNVRDLQKTIAETHSTRTTNDTISLLKSILQSAVTIDRIIEYNPAAPVKALRRTEPQARDNNTQSIDKRGNKGIFEPCRRFLVLQPVCFPVGYRLQNRRGRSPRDLRHSEKVHHDKPNSDKEGKRRL